MRKVQTMLVLLLAVACFAGCAAKTPETEPAAAQQTQQNVSSETTASRK